MNEKPDRIEAFFQVGLRPFFLFAGIYAVLAMTTWLLSFSGLAYLPSVWPGIWWHGHEMLFGFAAAGVSGFLLTAVPNWTRSKPLRGAPLAALAGVWLAGRVAMGLTPWLPRSLVAVADLIFFPCLFWAVVPPVLRARQRRNYWLPWLLAGLFSANLLIHLELVGVAFGSVASGLRLALYLVIALLCLISGRIVPSFTANALRRRGQPHEVRTRESLKWPLIGSVLLTGAVDLARPDSPASGALSAITAALLVWRAIGWQAHHTLREPIVWILHAGHAWLPIGFACKAWANLSGSFPPLTALHAFTAGAIGTMLLAVMSRAALGHTERPLEASRPVCIAYGLVLAGAAIRVAAPCLEPLSYVQAVEIGGALWALGYLLFSICYWPVLTKPTPR